MMWLLTAHVRRYHQHYHSSGHVWQGRFRAFPIQEDDHLLTVLRYIERNPVRACLVERAQDWAWSSAAPATATSPMLDPGPVPGPAKSKPSDNWWPAIDAWNKQCTLGSDKDNGKGQKPIDILRR
jgi:hypothetical protein